MGKKIVNVATSGYTPLMVGVIGPETADERASLAERAERADGLSGERTESRNIRAGNAHVGRQVDVWDGDLYIGLGDAHDQHDDSF
ncbi:hypothetical protein [Dactylosporangium sp. CA-092794]|uniref:hypothetical protein n=1 Tax=Dactylosporangium sp. CA-092794 TaxID=3239929 RepID=UPI003D8EBFBA